MTKKQTSSESEYNNSLTVEDVTRNEVLNPKGYSLLTYSKPHDTCDGIEIHLGNMAGGFPFVALGKEWKSVEHLYLCGELSQEGDSSVVIQKDICSATSGYAAKRFKKAKYKKEIRTDFPAFRHQWMLWCVWQKVCGSEAFRNHLLSMPDNRIIVEVEKNDPVWAANYDEEGCLVGQNGMGKILTICRNSLVNGTKPEIDTDLLNNTGIWIFGERVLF